MQIPVPYLWSIADWSLFFLSSRLRSRILKLQGFLFTSSLPLTSPYSHFHSSVRMFTFLLPRSQQLRSRTISWIFSCLLCSSYSRLISLKVIFHPVKGTHEALRANILVREKLPAIFPLLYAIYNIFFLSEAHGICFFLIVIKHQRLKQNFKSVGIKENLV